ncbi:hypothetical protein SLEP1_g7263 [Rubroshorea leprosula]|uniref:DRBM domain-containing protein n=1 Tax=Rubroshorea leprosula TaxID=152421 RepID=A0AAV5I3M3_9ROSI|nr:hypothetical protein SLEP1_g7263 [Rubroshorea leprosula]
MYKTKLQEMCHRRRWGLPKYAYMKNGLDHSPSFKASVSVNGMSFDSSPSCKSSKEALNDAAKLAFFHFDSPTLLLQKFPQFQVLNSILEEEEEDQRRKKHTRELTLSHKLSRLWTVRCIMASIFFNQFDHGEGRCLGLNQEVHAYCIVDRFKNLDSPSYCTQREGPSHKPVFKATVAVGGHTFESPAFFKTLKEAEHAAAKAALMSLYYDGIHEVDSGFYKNLLQELTQKESLSRPVYKTTKSGASHQPTFLSSVEVEGKLFYGKAGKSKKKAQAKAAEVACTILKEDVTIKKPINSDHSPDSISIVNPQDNHGDKSQVISSTIKNEEHNEQYQVQEVISGEDNMVRNKDSPSCSKSVPQASSEGLLSSATPTNPDIFAPSISDTNLQTATGVRSYLLHNRVRVYTSFPNIACPKGITVLPIGDNKWVPVSLEFPNEVCNL